MSLSFAFHVGMALDIKENRFRSEASEPVQINDEETIAEGLAQFPEI